jgi:hypothetical protein
VSTYDDLARLVPQRRIEPFPEECVLRLILQSDFWKNGSVDEDVLVRFGPRLGGIQKTPVLRRNEPLPIGSIRIPV